MVGVIAATLAAIAPALVTRAAEQQWRRAGSAAAAASAPALGPKADPRVRLIAFAPEEEAQSSIVRRSTTAAARGLGLKRQALGTDDAGNPSDEKPDDSFDPFELGEPEQSPEEQGPEEQGPAEPSAESLFDPFDQDDNAAADEQPAEEPADEPAAEPAQEEAVLDDALDAADEAERKAQADKRPAEEPNAEDEEQPVFEAPRREEKSAPAPRAPLEKKPARPTASPKATLEIPSIEREVTPPRDAIQEEAPLERPQREMQDELPEGNPLRDEVTPPSTMDEEVKPEAEAPAQIEPPRGIGVTDEDRQQVDRWRLQFGGQLEEPARQPQTPEEQAKRKEQIEAEQRKSAEECEESFRALKADTIRTVDLNIRLGGSPGEDFPFDCALGAEQFQPRAWPAITYRWKASALAHKPLYFEEVQLERYGHTWGPVLQPFVSGAHFFGTIPILPYKMGIETPDECVYTLGHYRPGSCAPRMIEAFPFTWRAAAYEGFVATGMAFIFP